MVKYDPDVSAAARFYTVAQFVIAIVAALWIGEVYIERGAASVLIPSAALWLLLLSLGMLNEGRHWATKFEIVRLAALVPLSLLAWHFTAGGLPATTWAAAGIYVVLSVAGTGLIASVKNPLKTESNEG